MVPAIKPSLILKFSLLLVVAATGCARGQLWGVETELLAERLRNGNYELLQHLDFEELKVSHARRLGTGALFYLSEIYGTLEMPESRRRFLEASLRLEEDPWRREAAERLLLYYRSQEMFRRQGEVAEALLGDYPGWDHLPLYHLESLYEQERFEELREALDDPALGEIRPSTSFPNPQQDLLLWDAVARHRTADESFKEPVGRLFRHYQASSHHIRVYRYFEYRRLLEGTFDPGERFWLEFRMAAAEEDRERLESLVSELDGPSLRAFLAEPSAIEDYLSRSLAAGGDSAALSRLLLDGIVLQETEGAMLSLPVLRRGLIEIADRKGDRRHAAEQFDALMEEVPASQRNSLLGSRVASLTETHPQEASKLLDAYAAPEPDSWFLRRAIEELTTELLRRGLWNELETLYEVTHANRYDAAAARVAVILSQGPERSASATRRKLEAAQRQDVDPYYRLMASLILGNDGSDAILGAAGRDTGRDAAAGRDGSGGSGAPESDAKALAFVSGYLDYALMQEAFAALDASWELIVPEDKVMIARQLARDGHYYESMRIVERLRREEADLDTEALQALRYPRAFAPILEGVSETYGLPIWIWYALVREESYFAPAIESYAGAVGLAQLMPSTAAEVAEREGIQAPDLTNPETNLRLGASYLSRLFDRFEEPSYAIMAYNGGQGRLRRWIAASQQPSVVLFHEAVPVHQTRHYLRKIAVTASGYALLYEGTSPRETLAPLFPDLMILESDS